MSVQPTHFEFKTYQYEPLPTSSSIRLLSFVRQRDDGPTVCGTPLIECTLRTVDLTTSPVYKALSYTWGDPGSTPADPKAEKYDERHQWPLAVNGKVHFVTRNLLEALQRIFLEGAPVINQRFPPFNKTTLIRAAESNVVDRVLHCLRLGADVHLKDRFGETALHYAAENGHVEVVRILLSYGADSQIRDKSGRTPLDCCLQRKRRQYQEVAHVLRNSDSLEKRTEAMLIHNRQPDNDIYDMWIDAICINQSDVAERTAQVALMSRIFSTAKSVVVWLGPEDMSTQSASVALQKDRITKNGLRDVRNLISRSWFTRKWIIQEISLAQAIEVWCGSFQINLDCLLGYGLERISPAGKLLESPPAKLSLGRKGLGVWDVLVMRHWIGQILKPTLDCTKRLLPPSLPALIALTWHFQSKDPRDRIFALLGIVSRYPVEDTPCDLVADYSMSTEDLFLKAGRLFVEAKGRNEIHHWNKTSEILEPLEGLSFVQHELAAVRDKPSWVPDFCSNLRTARLWDCRFGASGREVCCNIWPSDSRLLKVDGHLLDRVTAVEQEQRVEGSEPPRSVPDIATWFRITLGLACRYRNSCDMSRVEVLWRTLIADDAWDNQPSITGESFKAFLCQHMQSSRENPQQFSIQTNLLDQLRADDQLRSLPTTEAINTFKHQKVGGYGCDCNKEANCKLHNFHNGFKKYSSRRQIFRTELAYLGLGPRGAKSGDEIWLVAGARTPFILRRMGGRNTDEPARFRLVGECYIHGVMHGEALEEGKPIFQPIEIE
ncbi:hypothetical protein BX600DRAFT_491068 [Xylariales sp. PMI_506]|nr:hypothetical protein BX600DRAFT_491068 [Xylariales sp. PMI_506]